MDALDRALAQLAGAPAPPALDDIERRVLARIDAQPAIGRRAGIGIAAMTALALGIGLAGAELPATASPVVSLASLGGISPLAPSALLLGDS
jgi:hypothetical protein